MRILSVLFSAPLCFCAFLSGCSGGSTSASSSSGGGGTTSTPLTITSVAPTTVAAGIQTVLLTVTGTGFTSSTAVQVGGVVDATTYISSTQITASLSASQLASGSMLSVIALNGTVTTGSGPVFNLEVDNPVPVISTFAPSTIATGAASTTLTVTGTGFVPGTILQVNGTSRPTTYVTSTQTSVILTASDLATAGSISLKAVNPSPGGGSSSASSIAVNNPAPTLTGLSPVTVAAGATTPTTVTVTGTNFLSATTVLVGSSSRAATVVSSTQLTFPLTVADEATAGKLSISVVNPSPGGGTTNVGTITVAAPTPTPVLTSVSPNSLIVGAGGSYITVSGTNLTAASVVLWNGSPLVTSSIYYIGNVYYLSAAVPASLLTVSGTATITTSTPTALQPLSNALSLPITNPPPPTVTSISPAAGPINTGQTITLYGTGFTTASTVALNGVNVAERDHGGAEDNHQRYGGEHLLLIGVDNAVHGGHGGGPAYREATGDQEALRPIDAK